ncbi:MAG: dienelactone hydrolase family protein [Thermoplasmata archaeon]|nr:dienelactone hydrolase family protein [Thermoplasmata archaeon]
MTDADLMLDIPNPEFGSGIIGVCDVCGRRQAVIVLAKERFKLCVIDFLNKTWGASTASPGVPLPPYRSERVAFATSAVASGSAPGILLRPTKVVRHPVVLVTPDTYGLTTTVLEAGIRLAREGYEVLLPDLDRAKLVGPGLHATLGLRARGGIDLSTPAVEKLTNLYADALAFLRGGAMANPDKAAILGISRGGALALAVAAREQKLSALALAYPVPVRPVEIGRLLSSPTLVLVGRRDRLGLRAARQLLASAPAGRILQVDAGKVRHHFLSRDLRAYRLAESEAGWAQILTFLRAQLLPAPPKPPTPPTASPALPPRPASPPAAIISSPQPVPPAPVPPAVTTA